MTNVQNRNLGDINREITCTIGGVPQMRTCAYKGEKGQKNDHNMHTGTKWMNDP